MAGTVQADFLQPQSAYGLTIQTPSGNTIALINSAGIFSNTGQQLLSYTGNITGNLISTGSIAASSANITGNITFTATNTATIGIGTTPVDSQAYGGPIIDMAANSALGTGVASYYRNLNAAGASYGYIGYYGSSMAIGTTGNNLLFTLKNSELARFNSAGNFGIQTTSPINLFTVDVNAGSAYAGTANGYVSLISSNSNGRPCMQVQNWNTGQDTSFRSSATTDGGTTFTNWTWGQNIETSVGVLSWCYTNSAAKTASGYGSAVIRFASTGTITNATGSYGTISDANLKENIVDGTSKLSDIKKLKVRNYNFKSDPNKTKHLGFVAQEIQQVFPSLVEKDDVINPETKEKTGEVLSIKTTIIIPMLVKAVQELSEQVSAQANTIVQLQSRLAAANIA